MYVKKFDPFWGLVMAAVLAGSWGTRKEYGASMIEQSIYIVGIMVVLGASIRGLLTTHNRGKSQPRLIGMRFFRVAFASFGGAFGVLLLVSVLSMPVVGFQMFDAWIGEWMGLIWLCLAVILAPLFNRWVT